MFKYAACLAWLMMLPVNLLIAQVPVALPTSEPELQGVSTPKIIEFIEAANENVKSMHSFILLRHGKLIAEAYWAPEAADKPHVLWSLSKSFTSTAVGLAVAEGKLSIDDPVLKFFPEEAPAEPSANLKAMRVRDLLTMSTVIKTKCFCATSKNGLKNFWRILFHTNLARTLSTIRPRHTCNRPLSSE